VKKQRDLPPTQEHIYLKGILDGITIARNGTLALVLEVGAIDIVLLDPDERTAKIMQLDDLWRSLRFESQVVVSTRRQEMRTYLRYLEECLSAWEEEVEGAQTGQKRERLEHRIDLLYHQMAHLEALAQGVNALVRTYHWVIPHNPFLVEMQRRVTGKEVLTEEQFREAQQLLMERAHKVVRGLARIGLPTRLEDDEAIVEEILRFYFPTIPEEVSVDFRLVASPLVGVGEEV